MRPKASLFGYAYSSVSTLRVTIWLDLRPVRLPPSVVAKNLAVDDGLCGRIDGFFRQIRFRIGNGVADIFRWLRPQM